MAAAKKRVGIPILLTIAAGSECVPHCSVIGAVHILQKKHSHFHYHKHKALIICYQYEQLKKQKAKKGGKKKEDKSEAPAEAETSAEAANAEDKPEDKPEEKSEQVAPEPVEATSVPPPPAEEEEEEEEDEEPAELNISKQPHGRKPSLAVESRQRSESFYRLGAATGPLSPGVGVSSEVYREQAHKIEELEKENKRLAAEVEENEKKWKKGEEELEELRESRGDVALAVEKGKEADKLVCAQSLQVLRQHSDLPSREQKLSRSKDSFRKRSRKATNRYAVHRPPPQVKALLSTI